MKYTIDATDKKLGRIASEIASLLMGKNTTSFSKNAMPTAQVAVVNAAKLNIDPKKVEETTYISYTGYPGGLKTKTMAQVSTQKGKGFSEVLRRTVYGMLPTNKLRAKMIKNLTVSE